MTRKKLFTIIICIISTAIILTAVFFLARYIVAVVRHPAFSHDDYVYGNKLVIDNETPFEYDSRLGIKTVYTYPYADDTLSNIQIFYGNKIMREKNGYLYTVYSSPDNNLIYAFFKKNENGIWMLDHYTRTSMAYMHDELMKNIYEYDAPSVILENKLPEATIDNEEASMRTERAANSLYTIRYNLGLVDIRDIVANGTYAQAYRMTFEGIFHGVHYIDFYVHHDGTGTLIYKRYNSEESINAKELFEDVTYSLSTEETASLLGVWEEQDFFFSIPSIHIYEEVDISILDGYYTYLEGIDSVVTFNNIDDISIYSEYHMSRVHDHNLVFPEFWAIRDAMVAMVESKGTEVRFNMTHQEEELRANQGN